MSNNDSTSVSGDLHAVGSGGKLDLLNDVPRGTVPHLQRLVVRQTHDSTTIFEKLRRFQSAGVSNELVRLVYEHTELNE